MSQEIILKFEERKDALETELQALNDALKEHSKRVSETQILIIETRGELRGVNKMIEELKK